MTSSESRLAQLAAAIMDGTAVDWTAAESGPVGTRPPYIEHLKVVAALAGVHRSAPEMTPHRVGPERWGHLRLLACIGHSAFGEVYRAWDTRLDREVALKLLPADRASGNLDLSSIIHEGQMLARVRHPNVATIYGAEQIGDRIGLWMEFVRGRTLGQMLSENVFTAAETARIGGEICRAVAAVHGAGVLHRDIKAHNVMLADDGRVVLMDFGTGRELADAQATDLAGTPLYLAPEVFAGQPATVQSDIYSLGVLLFHLVSGAYPVHARTTKGLRAAHERNARTALHTACPGVPPSLARVIDRAIDPRPEHRYQNADAMAAGLAAVNRRPPRVSLIHAMGVAAGLILVIAVGWEVLGRQVGSSRTSSALLARAAGWNSVGTPNVSPVEQPVIAVLPFKNLSVEPESDDFVDGLTDEIIRNLAVIQGLQVRSSTSSFTFKDKPRALRDVGEQLGANLVLEGSVLRSGNKLRINAALIQVAGDRPLWSDRFDRELKDIFAIQDEISRVIVNKLRLTLGRGQRRYDANVEAYELYLKGRALVGRRGIPSLEKAADLFQQVLAKDPAFAPAHAGLANAYALMSAPTASLPFETAHSILRPAAVKALELDPLLADAHAAMGWVYSRERDWANAEKAFQRAIELNPSLTQTYTSFAISTLQPLGKLDEALRILQVALRNDPLSLDVQREIGRVQLLAGRYGEAIDTLERVLAVEPRFPFVEMHLARALMLAGRLAEAVALLEKLDGRHLGRFKAPQTARQVPWLAQVYVMTGRRADAETLVAANQDSPASLAIIYAALGDKDRSFEALERMAVVQPHHVLPILMNPEMAGLRGDPRLAALRERFGLPAQ